MPSHNLARSVRGLTGTDTAGTIIVKELLGKGWGIVATRDIKIWERIFIDKMVIKP